MTSNRPFLSNFLAAFRAHSTTVLPKAGPSLSTSTGTTAGATVWSATSFTGPTQQTQPLGTLSSPRAIATDPRKVTPSGARSTSPGPVTTPPTTAFSPPLQHNVSPRTHGTRAPSSSRNSPERGVPNPYAPPQPETRRVPGTQHIPPGAGGVGIPMRGSGDRRRGSDSSSEGGFRDVANSRGGEKWYIGGRTAGGEERYYKLGLVRRERSADRLSADRLSL